jgi:hypothetical protein
MYGLGDDIREYQDEIERLKSEKNALIGCLKLMLIDATNPNTREIADAILKAMKNSKRD